MPSRDRTARGGACDKVMTASVFQNPELLTAWATVGLFGSTQLVGGATCLLIWTGIREMRRSSNQRAQDRREAREADLRRHEEAMEEGRRLHEEAQEEGRRRHEETMAALKALNEEAQEEGRRRHEEAMAALKALIERTAPSAAAGMR